MIKKKNKGFTLVEVLVGFVIITLALVMLGTSFLSSVRSVKSDRERSDLVFQLKNEMETEWTDRIELVTARNSYWDEGANKWKIDITDPKVQNEKKRTVDMIKRVRNKFGAIPPATDTTYTCCGMNVKGYALEVRQGTNAVIVSFVSNRYKDLKLPGVAEAWIDKSVPRFQYLEAAGTKLDLKGDCSKVENEDLLYDLQHRWYVSNRFVFPEGGSGESTPGKAHLDYQEDPVFRTARFNSDYQRLDAKKGELIINTGDAIYRDAAVKYTVAPLGLNKYVGDPAHSLNAKYYIGLPLDAGNDLMAHYNADMVMNYDETKDEATPLMNFTDYGGGDQWFDVRTYTGMMTSLNPLELKKAELKQDLYGDYARFTKDAEGLIKETDFSLFIRVKDADPGMGKKIILLQSAEIEETAAYNGKKMFQLALEDQKLILYTKEVTKEVAPDGTATYKFVDLARQELMDDTVARASYAEPFTGKPNPYEGYSVFLLKFSGESIRSLEQFALKSDIADPTEKNDLLGTTMVDSLAAGDLKLAVDGSGSMAITDIVMYKGEVSEDFAERIGDYLLKRYMPN